MSIDLMTQVWKSDAYDGGTLLVLLALADWAADDGTSIFPKVATVGKKARLCPRQVQNCFAQLRKDEVLIEVAKAKRGRGTEYRLDIDRVKELRRNSCVVKITGEAGFRKGVKPSAFVGTNPIAPPIVEPPVDPSENHHSHAPSGASEGPASIGFEEFRETIVKTWPGAFPSDDAAKARKRFQALEATVTAETLIACAAAHGAYKTGKKAERERSGLSSPLMQAPSNWLKDGGWEGYVKPLKVAEAGESDTSRALARVHSALGVGMIEILRRVGMTDAEMAYLDGATFEDGPPPQFVVPKPFAFNRLEKHAPRLQRELGDDLLIVLAGTERKSA